jgi:hypothetical protein
MASERRRSRLLPDQHAPSASPVAVRPTSDVPGTLIGTNGKRCMCGRSNRVSGPVSIFPEGKACASQQEKDHTFQGNTAHPLLRASCHVNRTA